MWYCLRKLHNSGRMNQVLVGRKDMFITDGAFVVKSPHVQINAVLCIEPMQSRLCIVFAFTALYYSFFVGFCGISTFSHSFRITRLNYFTRFWIRLSSNLHPFLSIIFVVFANILLPWTNFKMYSPFIFVTVKRFVHHIQIHYSTWKPTGFSIRLYSANSKFDIHDNKDTLFHLSPTVLLLLLHTFFFVSPPLLSNLRCVCVWYAIWMPTYSV